MDSVVIVGSGPSAVHFALSVLQKGYRVTMLDVGYSKPPAVNPGDNFVALKENLADPVRYFLGERFEGVVLPNPEKEFYGIPPSKDYVLRHPGGFTFDARGFAPFFSFAQGGIAEAWTGGCYPFNAAEITDFPFDYAELERAYAEVAARIGVIGAPDDLARFFPLHENLLEPLELDVHSALLMSEYEKRKAWLNRRLRCYFGRTRIATLSRDLGARKKCSYLGRCLWGCPTDSFYTPSITLRECLAFPHFTYQPGLRVTHFEFDGAQRVISIVAEPAAGGAPQAFSADRFALAAGALNSTKIYLESIFRSTGERVALGGLMDNRQILMPFVNLRMIGKPCNPESYQYHQLGMGIESDDPRGYVHGQITTLKTAMLHPIAANLPCDLRTAAFLVHNMHAALGIVNVNLHDTRRQGNFVSLAEETGAKDSRLIINYAPENGEVHRLRAAISTVRRALLHLGCIVPPGMLHVRPMGASVHYAGTLPMSRAKGRHTTSETCQSHEFPNLFIVDGATFPFLPAKNITFSLMANAVRVASRAF
ncbi:MAG: hypothetical protein HY234_01935 [Acidobacteria bacterium]|nr:hypothetical protein [Acidobacteriota bacterium]